jgi:hypothetical protein
MMAKLLRAAFFIACFFYAGSAFASGGACPSGLPVTGNNCYFIAANGADTNSGTTESSPWLHAPGMPNCKSNCAAVTPAAGNGFIFRGGDTWHFGITTDSANNPASGGEWAMYNWGGGTCNYEGTTSGCIYWGVDKTWFSGSGWARPILNGDNPTSTSLVASCAYQVGSNNNAMGLYNGEYFDNFELTGFCSSRNPASSGPSQDIWIGYGGTGSIFETNLYIHGWTATTSAGTSNNVQPCTLLGGSTQSTAQQFLIGIVIDGSDSNPGACAWGLFPMFSHMKDSIIRYTTQGVGQNCHDIHDNIFEYIYNPDVPTHGNILECNGDANGSTPNVFYNNTMRHINPNFFSSGQVGWWFCPNTTPEYWFNNLVYDTGGNGDGNLWAYAGPPIYSCSNTGGQYMFNNTLVDALQPCNNSTDSNGGLYLTVYNEHLINTPFAAGGAHDCAGHNDASNIVMTDSTSSSQGYTSSSAAINSGYVNCTNESTAPCSPTAANNSTVGAGANHMAYCNALAGFTSELAISADAANACKYGTTDGCSYNLSNHTMSCPAQTPVARPTIAAWDAGAYQFSGSQAQAPQPPTGLQAAVQ